jgi:hypothetical protein
MRAFVDVEGKRALLQLKMLVGANRQKDKTGSAFSF